MAGKNGPVPVAGTNTVGGTLVPGIVFPTAALDKDTNTYGLGAGVYVSAELENPNCRGVRLFTVVANGSGTVTVKIQIRTPYTNTWIDLAGAATAALNNNTGAILTVYPGLTGIADSTGVTINQHLGSAWRLVATVATATETFSVAADYLA